MGKPLNESFFKSLLLGLIPLVIGTLIFGVILESYKGDLNFRSDIMKEYYSPLIKKERQCGDISVSLSNDYIQKVNIYNELIDRYNANQDGSGPRLTEEYRTYLLALLKKAYEYNDNSDNHHKELVACRQEMYQDFINIALVTGTVDEFHSYNNKLNESLTKLDAELNNEKEKVKTLLSGLNISEIINEFFIAGDLTDERFSSSKKTGEAINTVFKPLMSFFVFNAEFERKVNNNYYELFNSYNAVLEKEIGSRYKRNWLAKLLN
ncbi:hypothetical protein SME36J_51440 (plasmid) [Serratia marcescens]|nr:hypothetical protein SME36J_51440 [Serratia marcescens]